MCPALCNPVLCDLFVSCRISKNTTWQTCENTVEKRGEIRNETG